VWILFWDIDETGEKYRVEDLELTEDVLPYYEDIIIKLADYDPHIFEEYEEKGKVEPSRLKEALRKAVIEKEIFPVFVGSALRNKGIQPLIDAIVDLLPSPLDVPPVTGTKDGDIVEVRTGEGPLVAQVFKIQVDPEAEALLRSDISW